MRYCKFVLFVFCAAFLAAGLALAQGANDKNMQAYADLMKKDLRTQKQSLVDQAMGLEAAQKSQFWTIYDEYQKSLNSIWDQRIANITKYADNFEKMTDAVADQLAVKALDIEGQRTALKKKFYGIYKEKMGAIIAARFLQTESTIMSLMELQVGSSIPIIQ